MLILLLAGAGTALATGLGAIPVFLLGPDRPRSVPLSRFWRAQWDSEPAANL
jgi:hypothetical protein